jgi:phosphate transport system substrate-binding protein
MKYILAEFSAAALSLAASAAFAASTPPKTLKFAGCSLSAVAYMKDMAKAYEAKYQVPVEVKGGGVPVGIKSTLDGKVELGGSCRHLLKPEIEKGARSTIVGYDMLVFIVNPSNPIGTLSMDQIRGIFSGKIKNWNELGGPDHEIIIVGRESEDSGVATMFREKVMRDTPITENRIDLQSTSDIELEMEKNQYGIAVTGISSARLRKLTLLSLNVTKPSRETFLNGAYPLARPLYLVTLGEPKGATKRFLDFVLSPEGQVIMAKNAFSLDDYCSREKAMTGKCNKG